MARNNTSGTGQHIGDPNVDTIDIGTVFRFVRRRLLFITLVMLAAICTGLAATLLIDPVYRATVVVAPASSSSQIDGLATEVGGLASMIGVPLSLGGSNRHEAVAVLRSRSLLERHLRENGAVDLIFPDMGTRSRFREFFGLKSSPPTIRDTYNIFIQDVLSVSSDRITGLMEVSVQWKDPEIAAAWANSIVLAANRELQNRAIQESDRKLRFLNAELQRVSEIDIRQSIFRLIESEMQRRMMAAGTTEFAFRVLDPATVPDADEHIRPQASLVAGLIVLLGLFICLAVLLRDVGNTR